MDKQLKKKLYTILVLLIIFVILLPNFSIFFSNVYGVTPGTPIDIPDSFEQCGAKLQKDGISWSSGTGPDVVNKIWVSQGKPANNNNWAYITIGGQRRYLVALAQTYGNSGDYVDIHLKNGKVYPCVIRDSESLHELDHDDNTNGGAFSYKDVTYGHSYDGKCSVVKIILKDYSKQPSTDFLNTIQPVTKIENGGSCLNGDEPEGLDASYVTVGVSVGSQEEWLQALEDMTNEMMEDGGWIYSNNNNKTDYREAKKASPRRTNCALMVSHALQYFGAFESNMKFYNIEDGSLKYNSTQTRERLEKIAEITPYEKGTMTTDKADLQPGDILTYYGQHVNVFKGLSESGKKMWYDAGRGSTSTCSDGGKFSKFKRTIDNISMDISYIIRLKYNTIITEDQVSNGDTDTETETFAGALGGLFRDFWAAIGAFFDNQVEKRNDTTVLYSFKNVDNNRSNFGVGPGNGDIVASCEAVTKMLLARGCRYSLNTTSELICGDIDRQLNSGKYFCCATYVAAVLYYSGVLTESQINAYNYHWTGSGGIPDMLKAAGWTQVPASQAQPGDVINDYTVHVMIYAGNGKVWDQRSAVTSSSGTPPTGTTYSRSIAGCQVWRAPIK